MVWLGMGLGLAQYRILPNTRHHVSPGAKAYHLGHPGASVHCPVQPRARSRPLPYRNVVHGSSSLPSPHPQIYAFYIGWFDAPVPSGDLLPPMCPHDYLVPYPPLVSSSSLAPTPLLTLRLYLGLPDTRGMVLRIPWIQPPCSALKTGSLGTSNKNLFKKIY